MVKNAPLDIGEILPFHRQSSIRDTLPFFVSFSRDGRGDSAVLFCSLTPPAAQKKGRLGSVIPVLIIY
jgi:hypothetical protein